MLSKSKFQLLKVLSFFSLIRSYNILVLVLAQYLSSIFILASEKRALDVLLDWKLFVLVLATTLSIASGYIVNNFYDIKKDLINRPRKSLFDRMVSQNTQWKVYFTLNFLACLLGFIISIRAALFYAVYIFLIWFYSHKLKKYPFLGNLTASLLAILPFFGILLYFKNFYEVIFAHAIFLFSILFIREIIKDLENIKGDLPNNYLTIPVKYGEVFAKNVILVVILLSIIPVYFLVNVYNVGYMDVYFYLTYITLIFFGINMYRSTSKESYLKLHFILKIILILGVFSIVLIKPEILANGEKILLK